MQSTTKEGALSRVLRLAPIGNFCVQNIDLKLIFKLYLSFYIAQKLDVGVLEVMVMLRRFGGFEN